MFRKSQLPSQASNQCARAGVPQSRVGPGSPSALPARCVRGLRPLALLVPLVALSISATPRPGWAADAHRSAVWLVNDIAIPLGDRLSFHVMLQNRWTRDVLYERTVVRPWFAVALPGRTEIAVGYDLHEFEDPSGLRDHRAWQRVAWSPRLTERVDLLSHFWLEERFLNISSDIAVRGRFNIGARVDLGRGFGGVVRNEFFVNLNTTDVIGRTGLRENQFVVELNKQLGHGVSLRLGYLQQWFDLPGANFFNHTAVMGFTWRTPRLMDLF